MRVTGLAWVIVASMGLIGCASNRHTEEHTWGRVQGFAAPSAPLPATPNAAAEGQTYNLTSQPNDLRVMTFNLRVPFVLDAWNFWSLRRDLVAKTVEAFNP